MDGTTGQQPERLEDQLRRMILSNGSPQTGSQDVSPTTQPNVRLPPSGSSTTPAQYRAVPPPARYEHRQPSQRGSHGFSRGNFNQTRGMQYGPPTRDQGFDGPPDANAPPPWRQQRSQYGLQPSLPKQRGGFSDRPGPPPGFIPPHQRAWYQQQAQIDPNAFQRGGPGPPHRGQYHGHQQLFNPNQPQGPPQYSFADQHARQTQYFEQVAAAEISSVEMSSTERNEKESFRLALEQICREVCAADPERLPKVSLECFGSFKSGFATAGSDMDLVIVIQDYRPTSACFSLLEDDLPRALEKRLLQLGYGARLLSRTRVPIIKVCEKPRVSLLDKLREEREKWDVLPNEKKYPHLYQNEDKGEPEEPEQAADGAVGDLQAGDMKLDSGTDNAQMPAKTEGSSANGTNNHLQQEESNSTQEAGTRNTAAPRPPRQEPEKPWTRERKAGPLDFPKTGVGIQSDINFFNPLGLHNTQMLRCYSLCDPRVRPMVLFVKAWAKRRKINSSYSGTLSSYGYVLMVLHYLVNVAQPPVLPNLQGPWRPMGSDFTPTASTVETVNEWNVTFWRNEREINTAAATGHLTANHELLGSLLAGFYTYYSSQGGGPTFRWMAEVLSLRSYGSGGVLSKEEKGWVKAVTEEGEGGKRIQHRYLFCIEDPFELAHNVARTVTHRGIVAIRDEFRRARRILVAVGRGEWVMDGELFEEMVEGEGVDIQIIGGQGLKGDGSVGLDQAAAQVALNQQPHAAPDANARDHLLPTRSARNLPLSRPSSKAPNVQDNAVFPALGGPSSSTKPSKKKKQQQQQQQQQQQSPHGRIDSGEDFSEISGTKAKAVVEEARRKKAEIQAERTAMGAVEAVLGGWE